MDLPRAAFNSYERSLPLDLVPACLGGGMVMDHADREDFSKKAAE